MLLRLRSLSEARSERDFSRGRGEPRVWTGKPGRECPGAGRKHSRADRGQQRLLGTAPSAPHSAGGFRAFRTYQYTYFFP